MKKTILILTLVILSIFFVSCKEEKEYYNPLQYKCLNGYEVKLSQVNLAKYSFNGTIKECYSSFINVSETGQYVTYCCNSKEYRKINESELWVREDLMKPLAELMQILAYEQSKEVAEYYYTLGYKEAMGGKNENK